MHETFQSRDPMLSELAHELGRAVNLDISLRKRAVEGLMEEVLRHLVRKYGESETSIKSEGISSNKLETVMAYVSENLSEKISLDEMVQIVG